MARVGRILMAALGVSTGALVAGVGSGGAPGAGVAAAASAAVAPSPSPGCRGAAAPGAPPPQAGGGPRTVPFTGGGRRGAYVEEVPTAYRRTRPMPVVFDFHGYSEPASLQASLSGLGAYGQKQGFITITPGVSEPVPLWLSTPGSADLAFFAALLGQVERTRCIDERRVYVTGYSNGAFMSSAIACQFPTLVAAVAPVAGIQTFEHCSARRPVPVVAFHGTADPFVHFDGSPSATAAALPAPDGSHRTLGQAQGTHGTLARSLSIPAQAAAWAHRNRCGRVATTGRVASDVTLTSYPCPAAAAVELYVVAGGGHAWPGSPGSAAIASIVGRTTFSISADAVMWRFFEQHPLGPARA